MASKKQLNERCPLQGDCERKCLNIGSEAKCDFFMANLTPETEDSARRAGIVLPTFEESIDWDSVPDLDDDLDDVLDDHEHDAADDLYPVVTVSDSKIQFLGGERGYTAKINDCIDRIKHEFIFIGFLLHEVEAFGYYREAGFNDVYEYCEVSFGFKRSSTNNFIRIYRKFGEAKGLQDRYKGYSYSQLTEMCSMNDNQLRQCHCSMSVQSMRELKRSLKISTIEVEPVQTSGKDEVKIALSGQAGTYSVPVWLTCKLVHYLNHDGDKVLWDVIDAGLVSLFGCKPGYENVNIKK